ncbi:YsnF/AvaK domain-containing protein [Paenibacillus sp. S-38]|uniref:YsnF/AvaK domain-containing protein n=1 Tax=Paenibacillus sp. S-38 TaxID=3416710 RepID=UPI003CEF0E31
MSKQIVGVFNTEEEAIRVIDQLKDQGYSADDISVVGKNRGGLDLIEDETGSKAEEGVATGAAAGGMLGGVTGLLAGIGALAIPGVGPIIAAGPIAAALTGAAVGAGAGGIVGGLIGLGIPEDEARDYDAYVQEGKILVLVESDAVRDEHAFGTFRSNNSLNAERYGTDYAYRADSDSALERAGDAIGRTADRAGDAIERGWEKTKDAVGSAADKTADAVDRLDGEVDRPYVGNADTANVSVYGQSLDGTATADLNRSNLNAPLNETEEERELRLREERLQVDKQRVQSGEVSVRKEVIEEQQTINVPVSREEVYIERRDVTDGRTDNTPLGEDEVIRIPVTEERVEVTKKPVVTGEVAIGKREVTENRQVSDTVKREEAVIDSTGETRVKGDLVDTDEELINRNRR